MNAIVQLDNLSIGYHNKIVAENINATLYASELVCLLGPNGVGKSTLIRTINGMQPTLDGRILLSRNDIHSLSPAKRARLLSVVLTDRVDAGMLTVYDLVGLGRYPYTGWRGQLNTHDREIVEWAINTVAGDHLRDRFVMELSDGERQKIMIARALAQDPTVMLLDEPTAYLDLPHRVEVMQMLRRLARDTGCAILLSTHDLDLALRTADRIWLMDDHGCLEMGAPEDLVLNGAFGANFQRSGITFDRETGSFTVVRQQRGMVHLSGDGIPAMWTGRALERAGYQVSRNGTAAPIQVEVIEEGECLRWRYQTSGRIVEHNTIYELLASIDQQVGSLT